MELLVIEIVEAVELGQEVFDGFLGLPEAEIFLVPDCVDDVDYLSKDLLVEKHH